MMKISKMPPKSQKTYLLKVSSALRLALRTSKEKYFLRNVAAGEGFGLPGGVTNPRDTEIEWAAIRALGAVLNSLESGEGLKK